MTLAFFIAHRHHQKHHDSQTLFNLIQWQTEALSNRGLINFYESSTLESIRNAVAKFVENGVLSVNKIQIKRNLFKTNYSLSSEYQDSDEKIYTFFNKVKGFLPSQSHIENDKVFDEIRKLMVSDIIPAKL